MRSIEDSKIESAVFRRMEHVDYSHDVMGIPYDCQVKILDIIYQATVSNTTRNTGTLIVAAIIRAALGMHLTEQSWFHLFCTYVPTKGTVTLHTPTDSE
jgi:hypothetical protein